MSKETAEDVKARFVDTSAAGESLSYMDCVLMDAALDVLGLEQAYYGIPDDEWAETLRRRRDAESRYEKVKTIDVTDTWREVASVPGHVTP
jgi:hypothetical protein